MENHEDERIKRLFEMIGHAGSAKSDAMEAIQTAKKGCFEQAEALLEQARQSLNAAHGIHFGMLSERANGDGEPMDIMAVHAQDHLSMATVTIDMAQEIVELHRLVSAR